MAQVSTAGRVRAYLGRCDVAEVRRCRERFGGVTLQGIAGLKIAKVLDRMDDLWGVDIDPAVYRDRPRRESAQLAFEGLDFPPFDWIEAQAELGLPVVRTASPRIRVGRVEDLQTALNRSYPVDVSVTVAVDGGWLGRKHSRSLEDEVRRADRDVSLVFAAAFDPFDTAEKIGTVRRLLRWAADAGRKLELLRTDLVGLPAVLDGATAAVGFSTSTRHLGTPLAATNRRDYQRRQRSPLVFVPRLLHWQRANVLGALAPWNGAGLTECDCPPCQASGKGLLRFDVADGAVTAEMRNRVREHDEYAMSSLVHQILEADNPQAELKHRRINAAHRVRSVMPSLKVNLNLPPAWLDKWD